MSSDETLIATCPRCEVTFRAADEDELVAIVQQHVRNDHGFEHELPRKHILAYLRKTGTSDVPADPNG
jgi:predicted small metal-binding protein